MKYYNTLEFFQVEFNLGFDKHHIQFCNRDALECIIVENGSEVLLNKIIEFSISNHKIQ